MPGDVLAAHGAVSAQTRSPWRRGGRARTGADLGVAVTGIAGPDGGSAAEAGRADLRRRRRRRRASTVRRYVWTGTGATTSGASAEAALELLLERIDAPLRHPRRDRARDDRPRRTASVPGSATREARPIRAGERIHVVGAAGAGASAAALLAAGGRGDRHRLRSRRAVAVHAGARGARHRGRGRARRRARDRRPAPDRLAVTKALTAIDPDHPSSAAARRPGVPVEPWQQVVADAAVGRTLVGVAGTHGKSTTAGWLVHVLAAAGADPSAFVGALLPSTLTGGPPATARIGAGAGVRRRGRRVRRQLRRRTGRTSRS